MKKILHVSIFIVLFAFSFQAQVPDSPVLTEPPDVDIIVPTTVTIEWNSVNNATSYEIQISQDSSFSTLVTASPVIVTTNQYQLPSGYLNNFSSYFWRVRARNNNGPGDYSLYWRFRTAGTPSQEISSLEEVVQVLAIINSLNPAQARILLHRLNIALNFYSIGHPFTANIHLQIFKLRVYILMFSNYINNTDGNRLIYNTDKIIALINGDNPAPEELIIPNDFELKQNYPNPFNPSTTIEYTIPENSKVSLKIYDILGKEIATLVDKEQNSGTYIVTWDAKAVSSGIYFYKITAGKYSDTKRMILKK